MNSCKHILILGLTLLWLAGTGANVVAKDDEGASTVIAPDMSEAIGAWVDNAHAEISQQILGTADRFDGFFGDERIDEEKQNTQISLGISATLRHDAAPILTFPLGLKLSLPRLKNRVQLAVDTLLQEEANQPEQGTAPEEEAKSDIQVKVRYKMLEQMGKWISVDGGVKMNFETLGLHTLEPFGSLRVRNTFEFQPWALRATQVVNWYEQSGWDGLSRFDLERDLGQNTFFRISATTTYAEAFAGQRYTALMFLRHQFSHTQALGVQLSSAGETHPRIQTTVYEAQLTYRRRIYKEWAFFSIQPVTRFTREDHFALTPLLRFELKLYFGRVGP